MAWSSSKLIQINDPYPAVDKKCKMLYLHYLQRFMSSQNVLALNVILFIYLGFNVSFNTV